MLAFDLNSLVTVLVARKLGTLCNVTSIDLQMEQNIPNLASNRPILDSVIFNIHRTSLTLEDPEYFFNEMARQLSFQLLMVDDNLEMNEIIDNLNFESLAFIDSMDSENEEALLAVNSKFKENQISFQLLALFPEENVP